MTEEEICMSGKKICMHGARERRVWMKEEQKEEKQCFSPAKDEGREGRKNKNCEKKT